MGLYGQQEYLFANRSYDSTIDIVVLLLEEVSDGYIGGHNLAVMINFNNSTNPMESYWPAQPTST